MIGNLMAWKLPEEDYEEIPVEYLYEDEWVDEGFLICNNVKPVEVITRYKTY